MGLTRWLCIFLLSLLPAAACKWDRDTLAEEAKHGLDSVKACVGWFDRYPPRYYEMRLARVTAGLAADPAALDLYDDAGVACDRLGRYDEAIAWMAKKQAVLERQPPAETADQRYRCLANLGSFFMDRWIARPAAQRAADLGDLEAAEKRIAAAIELNPDAHFGRERYQLQMIRWLLATQLDSWAGERTFLDPAEVGSEDPAKVAAGLTGLVMLGEGWASIDVFDSLQQALADLDQNSIAELAYLRAAELEAAGSASLHPRPEIRKRMEPESLHGARDSRLKEFFQSARAAADARLAAWHGYQEERFAKGLHPDTDAGFWRDWREPSFPQAPGVTLSLWLERHPLFTLSSFVVALAGVLLGLPLLTYWISRRRRKRRRLSAPAAVASSGTATACPVPSSASTSPSPPMARSPQPPSARPAGPPPPITRG